MNHLESLYELSEEHPIIFYDAICVLCDGFIQFTIRKDTKARFKYCMLQSKKGMDIRRSLNLPIDEITTVVALYNKEIYTHSEVLRLVINELGGMWKILLILYIFPKSIRDWGYEIVADNRYRWFGKADKCLIPNSTISDRFI